MAIGEREKEVARKLFEEGGWSSGDPYGPDLWFSDDAVMRDIVNHDGALRGKEEIRYFWARQGTGITLRVPVEELFVSDDGVAVLWMAYSQVTDDRFGPENRGKWLCFEGMSRLEFNDEGKCTLEVDYHHGPQGITDSWVAHWEKRRAMTREERGALTGGDKPMPELKK
ncbi:MAG: nuclear transport factor 2 family protein [Dehalococcoidia bacterium]|nr:nuclear transport factor 2 family protein [Dehalococcoidia bacterium]